jgi:hypothetical protein
MSSNKFARKSSSESKGFADTPRSADAVPDGRARSVLIWGALLCLFSWLFHFAFPSSRGGGLTATLPPDAVVLVIRCWVRWWTLAVAAAGVLHISERLLWMYKPRWRWIGLGGWFGLAYGIHTLVSLVIVIWRSGQM